MQLLHVRHAMWRGDNEYHELNGVSVEIEGSDTLACGVRKTHALPVTCMQMRQ